MIYYVPSSRRFAIHRDLLPEFKGKLHGDYALLTQLKANHRLQASMSEQHARVNLMIARWSTPMLVLVLAIHPRRKF